MSRTNGEGQATKPFAAARGSVLAERIADALLLAHDGAPATRLELKRVLPGLSAERSLGGWCRSALVGVILRELEKAPSAGRSDHP